jgi:hypothetical protein
MIRRRWILAVALGLLVACVMALVVLHTEDVTARPDGLTLVGALAWRGLLYGIADGVLLSAFPILVVYAAFAGSLLNKRRLGRLAIGLAALAASLAMTRRTTSATTTSGRRRCENHSPVTWSGAFRRW